MSYVDDGYGCVDGVPDFDDESDLIGSPHYGHGRDSYRDPGGRSALRRGHRTEPCPTCKTPNALTRADVQRGYQCDHCADREEGCC